MAIYKYCFLTLKVIHTQKIKFLRKREKLFFNMTENYWHQLFNQYPSVHFDFIILKKKNHFSDLVMIF